MDNRLFNVNGSGLEMLTKTLELVFEQRSSHNPTCEAWEFSKEKGLVLNWHNSSGHKLPTKMTAEQCANFVWDWLKTDESKQVKLSEWCNDLDHDGSNSLGWQVYCEDWGKIEGHNYAICAVKPAYMWHGK